MRKLVCTTPLCGAAKTEVLAAAGHQWDGGKVTRAATEKAEGIKTYTCTVCGAAKTEAIAKLAPSGNGDPKSQDISGSGHAGIPKTGDPANVWMWGLPAAVSAGAAIVFLVKRRACR